MFDIVPTTVLIILLLVLVVGGLVETERQARVITRLRADLRESQEQRRQLANDLAVQGAYMVEQMNSNPRTTVNKESNPK